jgi:hypothetical protein
MGHRRGRGMATFALAVWCCWWPAACSSSSSSGSAPDGGARGGSAGTANGGSAGTANGGSAGGASGGSAGGATEPPADAIAFCAALHGAEVDRLVACSGSPRAPLAATYGQAWRCDGVAQAVATGTATYDRVQAGACLDWLAHLPCGHALKQPYSAGPCEMALVGQVADGGACTTLDIDLDLSECARTSRCDTSLTCPGICRPNIKVGQPCDSSTPCERGSYCGALHAGDPPTCLAVGGPGQSCDATYSTTPRLVGSPGPLVGSADVCVEGYHCDLASAVCVPETSVDPCKRGETFCPNGYCVLQPGEVDPATGATLYRNVCQPLSGNGGPCADLGTSIQSFPYCPPGSACTSDQAFQCVPLLVPGAACDPSTTSCAEGFGCGTSNSCEPVPPTAGWTCTRDLPCGHPGEGCCFCSTCGSSIFNCGAGATCSPSRTCVAS